LLQRIEIIDERYGQPDKNPAEKTPARIDVRIVFLVGVGVMRHVLALVLVEKQPKRHAGRNARDGIDPAESLGA
jgi:hypothetical protein